MRIAELEGRDLPLTDTARKGLGLTIEALQESIAEIQRALDNNDSLAAAGALEFLYDGAEIACVSMRNELLSVISQVVPEAMDRILDIANEAHKEAKAPAEAMTGTKGGE